MSDPLAPGQVNDRPSFWGLFAFLPLVVLALAGLAFWVGGWPFTRIRATIVASPADWVLAYTLGGLLHAAAFALHAWKNELLFARERGLWIVAFALASTVAAPIYWFKGFTAR
jgi:hypothetical protein